MSRVLEKFIVTQPVKNSPPVIEACVFIRIRHWFMSWARRIKSTIS